ncbi:MAG: DUF58 domain-containing protein [Gemmatimonadota bacterium]
MSRSRQDPEALLRRIEWTVVRRLDGILHGDYRTLFRGMGLDLADLREYELHDDVRHMDWNVTARLQVPHVREFHEDRDLTTWFLLDTSPSVDFGSSEVRKRSVLLELVAVLALLLSRGGNRVGGVLYDREVHRVLPPRGGRNQVLRLLREIDAPREVERSGGTELAHLLEAGAGIARRRSLVFVISDFISTPGWHLPLLKLARRHEVLAIRLLDPLEVAIPDLGLVMMEDSETGEQLLVDTHDPGFRRRFAAAAAAREEELLEHFERAGVDALELSTEDQLVEALLRFAELRKTRNRLVREGRLPVHLGGRPS